MGGVSMDCREAVAAILADAERTVGCQPSGRSGAWLVTTTGHYSDDDLVQVVIEQAGESVRVSDGGLSVMRLELNGAPWSGTARRERMVTIARSFGVDLDEQYVLGDTVAPDGVAVAVRRVVSAAIQIDALIHDDPVQRSRNFSDQVSDWLRQRTTRDLIPDAPVPGTTYTATFKVATVLPVFIQAVGGSTPADRRRQAVTAGWEYEASDLRPEQAVVLLKGGRAEFPTADIQRLTEFATLATWDDRVALSAHIESADRDGWSTDRRILSNIQLMT